MKAVFDNTYTGRRWTYGLKYRPLAKAEVQDGWIIQSDKKHPDFSFGIVDYPFELTEEQLQNFQMVSVFPLALEGERYHG